MLHVIQWERKQDKTKSTGTRDAVVAAPSHYLSHPSWDAMHAAETLLENGVWP